LQYFYFLSENNNYINTNTVYRYNVDVLLLIMISSHTTVVCVFLQLRRQWICRRVRRCDSVILIATSQFELQELVVRLDRVSKKFGHIINVDRTKVMAAQDSTCNIKIEDTPVEQVDVFT